MLRAIPKGWWSPGYRILEGNSLVATIAPSWSREAATITIQGATYKAYREGFMSGAFLLESDGVMGMRAEKPSALYRSFQVECNGRRFTLEAESVGYRKFVLIADGRHFGSVYPEGWFSRKAIVDLPESISLPGRIFMFWLVMILWKRDSEAAT
jgi:hypothetical protein